MRTHEPVAARAPFGAPVVCGCCGREDLKRTVPVRSLESGEVVWMGTGCAARACGLGGVREFRAAVEVVEREASEKRNAEERATRERWFAWLRERTGRAEVFLAIESLGGAAAAKALYASEKLQTR